MNQRDPEVQLLLRRLLLGALAAAIVVCAAITLALLTLNVDLLDAIESGKIPRSDISAFTIRSFPISKSRL